METVNINSKLIALPKTAKRYGIIYLYEGSNNYWNVNYQLYTTPEDALQSISTFTGIKYAGVFEIELPLFPEVNDLSEKIIKS